jgi:Flp pilus assembly protein TadD
MEDSAMLARKNTLLLLVGLAANCALSGARAGETSFELNYYANSPGGTEIAAHDYAGAISAAKAWTAGDPTTALISSTNLCVAYTKTGSFKEASKACDAAVALARGFDAPARGVASDSPSSRALSNRGVLRALRGDTAGALSDLRAAGKGPGSSQAPIRNLAYLTSSPVYRERVALADSSTD